VRRLLKILLSAIAVLLLLAVLAAVMFLRALRQAPEFYQAALKGDPARQKALGREMQMRSVELASHAQVSGRWQQTFTAEQINGWLAAGRFESVDGASAEARAWIPDSVIDPRVAIAPDGVTLACRFDTPMAGEVVLSLQVEPFLTEQNEIGLRIRKARAGAIPAPLDVVLKRISEALRQANCPARASQIDGDPVVLMTLPSVGKHGELTIHLETLRLSDGKLEVAGTTKRR
jgi:hypothetical protein